VTERPREGAPLQARDESAQGRRQAVLHNSLPTIQTAHTVSVEVTESSSRNNSMARKRYQRGSVFLSGKKNDKWIGRYRKDVIGLDGTVRRVRRDVVLGTKREFPTKRLAQRRLDAVLARINGLDYRACRVATFDEFLERWREESLPSQKPSSHLVVLTGPVKQSAKRWHSFSPQVPGLPFTLHLGKLIDVEMKDCCFHEDPMHPMFIADDVMEALWNKLGEHYRESRKTKSYLAAKAKRAAKT
jgi:hypothetical protein